MSDTESAELAELARAVEAAVITAGLSVADPHGPTTASGMVTAGVGVDVVPHGDHGRPAVMLSWGCADEAPYETVDIMLDAVAQALRLQGFTVRRHPIGRAYLVTGRTPATPTAP